jgi:hypothetical protein
MPLDPYQSPVAAPLGAPTVSGTLVTVDDLLNPVTEIPETIRELSAANEGYFAEEIFSTPGYSVQGGAVLYTPSGPDDHFLDPNQGLAPRAPGAEAPRLGINRKGRLVAPVESWSGSIEVYDETRRRNDVRAVTRALTRAANSFADILQSRAIATLDAFVTASSRTVVGTNWGVARPNGVPDADPLTLPQRDFALVMAQFAADKTGIRPDVLILNQDDAFYLDTIYGEKLQALLDRYRLRLRVSPHKTSGTADFVKAGEVGQIAFEKPFDTELTREGTRKTDVYTMEATPVFVADEAAAILRVTGIRG